MWQTLKIYSRSFLHILYPKICITCSDSLWKSEEFICIKCRNNLTKLDILGRKDNFVEKIFWGRTEIHSAAAVFLFSKGNSIQKLIHPVKYKKQKKLGVFLGELMGVELKNNMDTTQFDYIIPVPLHPKKEKMRGYNQSYLLAVGISQKTNIPVLDKNLIRNTFTETQTKKSRMERWKNTSGIFTLLNPEELNNKRILLIDDIVTTGSTLEACAETILQNTQNCQVNILTFAATN